jgi:tetratricopeptide (TPR) repeat protein
VRQYAYDRLVNKHDVHLTITHYFQSFAADVGVSARGDLDPVIELYHHQVAAGLEDAALNLLFERIFTPLVMEFQDVRTAVELFSALVPANEPMPSTWNDGDIAGWFNREYGLLLRRAGFVDRANAWSYRARGSFKARQAIFHASIRGLSKRSGQENLDLVRTLRETGHVEEALAEYEADRLPDGLNGVDLLSQIGLDLEHALSLASIGRSWDAERVLGEALPRLEQLDEGELLSIRALRYRSIVALLAEKPDEAAKHVAAAETAVQRCSRQDLETWEEGVAVAVERALVLVALSRRAAASAPRHARLPLLSSILHALSRSLGSVLGKQHDDASRTMQRLDELVTLLHGELRTCRERGMVETEIDVSFALACALLTRGDVEGAVRHADLVMMLSTRGGLRLRSLDCAILKSAIAARRGDADEARRLAEGAAHASRAGDHELRWLAAAVLFPAGHARTP